MSRLPLHGRSGAALARAFRPVPPPMAPLHPPPTSGPATAPARPGEGAP